MSTMCNGSSEDSDLGVRLDLRSQVSRLRYDSIGDHRAKVSGSRALMKIRIRCLQKVWRLRGSTGVTPRCQDAA